MVRINIPDVEFYSRLLSLLTLSEWEPTDDGKMLCGSCMVKTNAKRPKHKDGCLWESTRGEVIRRLFLAMQCEKLALEDRLSESARRSSQVLIRREGGGSFRIVAGHMRCRVLLETGSSVNALDVETGKTVVIQAGNQTALEQCKD